MTPEGHPTVISKTADQVDHTDCILGTCTVCQELGEVEKEIRSVEELLCALAQKRINLKTSRNASHSSFIRKLPVEIISQIFKSVDDTNDYSSTDKHYPALPDHYICAPALLSSVCITWRKIALSLPELWANVYINMAREPESDVIEKWLDRSRPLPLHLTLYAHEDLPKDWFSVAGPIFNALRSHSPRWQYLNLEHAPDMSLHHLLNELRDTPQSISFDLRLAGQSCYAIHLLMPLQLGRFHSTTTVRFPSFDSTKMVFGWNNLTNLTISGAFISNVLNIIRRAPKLSQCISNRMLPAGRGPDPTIAPVVNPSIQCLVVSFNKYDPRFFCNLTLPSLRQLEYNFGPYEEFQPPNTEFEDLTNFLSRSGVVPGTSLEKFTLGFYDKESQRDSSNRFFEMEAVTHLSVYLWFRAAPFSKVLEKMSDMGAFPQLKELRLIMTPGPFSSIDLDPSTYRALRNIMVTEHNSIAKEWDTQSGGRQHSSRPLKRISILISPPHNSIRMKKEMLLQLRESRKAGSMVLLEISDKDATVDILQDPRCEKDDGHDYVVLSLPT